MVAVAVKAAEVVVVVECNYQKCAEYIIVKCFVLQDLLYRRSRSLVDYENANKALDKARAKNKDVLQAEMSQQLCCQKFEKISESAKQGTVILTFNKVCFILVCKLNS